ncbi:MAG: DNA polymerase III subunit gamma/tau C-terminal domain-containing protein, partial [Legionella sp.]|nr:DNA polymerase III subunit gamma/tau C-terminal domain-containing protein [Legionella sp.]
DPQKLPVTVLSRCLQFNLKHLSEDVISHQLQLILKDEKIKYEPDGINILAKAAQGSMRDALSLLDQAITSYDDFLKVDDIKMILGYTQQDYAEKILYALSRQNASEMLTLSQQIAVEGGHFHYVLDEMLNYFHQITVYQSLGDNNPLIAPADRIKQLATQFTAEDIQLFYQIGLKGREEIHLAPTLVIGFNMTLLRMLTFRPALSTNIPPLAFTNEKKAPIGDSRVGNESPELTSKTIPPIPIEAAPVALPNPPQPDTPPDQEKTESFVPIETKNWAEIIPKLNLSGFARNAIDNVEFISKEGRDITLRVAKGHQSLFTPTTTSRIETALTEYYQSSVKIILNSDEAVNASPAQQKQKVTQQKQQLAEAALHNDPLFQQLQQEFSAELVKNSIVPLKDDL